MLTIEAPVRFKIGDTGDFQIDGVTKRVIWRDADTLLIAPGFPHRLLRIYIEDDKQRLLVEDRRVPRLTLQHAGDSVVVSNDGASFAKPSEPTVEPEKPSRAATFIPPPFY
jgi:hypothetical protein